MQGCPTAVSEQKPRDMSLKKQQTNQTNQKKKKNPLIYISAIVSFFHVKA